MSLPNSGRRQLSPTDKQENCRKTSPLAFLPFLRASLKVVGAVETFIVESAVEVKISEMSVSSEAAETSLNLLLFFLGLGCGVDEFLLSPTTVSND